MGTTGSITLTHNNHKAKIKYQAFSFNHITKIIRETFSIDLDQCLTLNIHHTDNYISTKYKWDIPKS